MTAAMSYPEPSPEPERALVDDLNAMQQALDKSLVESVGGAIFKLSEIILRQQASIKNLEAQVAAIEQRRWWRR